MLSTHLNALLRNKTDSYIVSVFNNFKNKNYDEALACYKMAKCLSSDFDQKDTAVWSKILYGLGIYFKNVANTDSAIYCLDRVIAICPDWHEAHYTRSNIIQSSLDHNSQENVDRLYANPRIVEEYLCPERVGFYSNFLDACLKHGIDFDGNDIADVGCGPGLLLQLVSERTHPNTVTGYDFSAEAIKVAEKKCPSGNFYQFDIYSTCSKDYDLVLCTETLEHLLYPDKALQNLISMTKVMGHLVLSVPNGRIDTFEGHINFWSPESWNVFIERSCNNLSYSLFLLDGKYNIAIINKDQDWT